jgi:Kef-type K+ transport system membrane component KefB/Trk K+ transport system NAD-binding subunit
MFNPFIQFGLIILVVLGVSIIIRLLKQPLIVGYILSGILVGPFFLNLIQESETLHLFSEMGIAFLLFIVGLHLSPRVIKEVGPVALVTGIGQILFTATIGYFIGILLGFPSMTSIYIATALTFSSTIIILKLITDKGALDKLYGKISVGFLLVQDFVAILILIIISSIGSGGGSSSIGGLFFMTLLKGIGVILIFAPISYFILPKIDNFLSKSQEFLFLFAIAWGFGLSILFLYLGFSIEVGALIAGILLSLAPYSYEMSSKLKPLRDFFLISFFLILGSQMTFANINSLIFPGIIFAFLVVAGNPLIVITLMGLMRYSKKTSFMAGLTVAQIGEFSLIFMALGVKVGHVSQEILSFVTLISLFTIFGCTYLIMYSEQIYNLLSRPLSLFERKKIKEKEIPRKNYEYILLGYNRIGFSIIKAFSKITKNFLVVDYNPKVVKNLQKDGINAIYGDADDSEFLEDLGICKSSVIVSTIPEKETNQLILDVLERNKAKPIVLLTGRQIEDALDLYDAGANYVILPHFLGGEYTANLIETAKKKDKVYQKERAKEIKILKERLKIGHKHPKVEKDKK